MRPPSRYGWTVIPVSIQTPLTPHWLFTLDADILLGHDVSLPIDGRIIYLMFNLRLTNMPQSKSGRFCHSPRCPSPIPEAAWDQHHSR